ncbi:MAG: hypothetical protein RJQ07_14600 [Pseudomonadales bacterium]
MKLRILGHSLRLRLTRGEVDALGGGEAVREQTAFPGGNALHYCLLVGDERGAALSSNDSGVQLSVTVPAAEAQHWATDDTQVGLSGAQPFSVQGLEILIEKDFTCLNPRDSDEELDTFPNPNRVS